MKLKRSCAYVTSPTQVTPLMNVVLLLLSFFLLSSTFIFQPGIKIDLPRNILGQGVRAGRFVVAVAMEPEHYDSLTGVLVPRKAVYFFNDQIVSLKDLDMELEKVTKGSTGQSLVIKADQSVPTGTLLEVMRVGMSRGLSVVVATQAASYAP